MGAPLGNKYAEGHGRPTKYKPEYDDQVYKLCLLGATDRIVKENSTLIYGLTIDQAIKIKKPCVYVIRKTDRLVYIGKTTNPSKRFEHYKYKICHNKHLNNWLKLNTPTFDIFICNKENISVIETHLIKLNKQNLVNIVYGNYNNWIEQDNKPWNAKAGVHCPSSILLMYLQNRRLDNFKNYRAEIIAKRNGLNDYERSLFEVDLARMFYDKFKNRIDNWLSYTQDKLIQILEHAA